MKGLQEDCLEPSVLADQDCGHPGKSVWGISVSLFFVLGVRHVCTFIILIYLMRCM